MIKDIIMDIQRDAILRNLQVASSYPFKAVSWFEIKLKYYAPGRARGTAILLAQRLDQPNCFPHGPRQPVSHAKALSSERAFCKESGT
ncbi:hypothetical protein HFO23_08890 [Rhizobium laguerreae]|nr:hypothetical protein [Rhizobium laguerreae]